MALQPRCTCAPFRKVTMTPGDILRNLVAREHDCNTPEDCSLISEELGWEQWDEIARDFVKEMLPRIEEDPM